VGSLAVLARLGDGPSADALVAFLAAHDIRAHVEGADPLSIGLGHRVRVVLAEEDARRARWLVDNASESGALFLGAAELDPDAAKRAFAKTEDRHAPKMSSATRNVGIVLAVLLAIAALLSR
jgi:hypothetical protein